MMQTNTQDTVERTFTVPVTPERAFSVFTSEMAAWWPREYTWAKDALETIGIEPEEGGRCFERGPHGFACDWGRVTEWDPPRRLAFLWQISPTRAPEPNPERASEVEVRFEADGTEATRVTLEHRVFSNHGEGAAEYRTAMDSAKGWTYILDRYREAAK